MADIQIDRDVWQLIQAFDRDRDRDILSRKYEKLQKNAFSFFRGTCHLFYRDLPIFDRDLSINLTGTPDPVVWICGDLHLENFGTYKGDDRQIYFGINDFDEGLLAPCTWDLARLATSIFLAADSLKFDRSAAKQLVSDYLTSYANTLALGNIRSFVADNSQGIVATLLESLHQRNRRDLLDERTELIGDRRRLKFDREKILPINEQTYQQVNRSIDNWASSQPQPDFFKVLDIGFRIAGTGSLGLDRYIILVEGKGSPHNNYLLDFKQQTVSAVEPYLSPALSDKQPIWNNQATRVMRVQQLVQSAPPALLAAIDLEDRSYLLRELQPTQDKIELKIGKIDLPQLTHLVKVMGQITAFAHLHGSGKSGAAIADELMYFGTNLNWQQDLLNYASNYAQQVELDYQVFCSLYIKIRGDVKKT